MMRTNCAPADVGLAWARGLGLLTLLTLAALTTPNLWGQAPQSGQGPLLVEEVYIHGLRIIPAEQIKAILKTQRDREFSQVTLQEDFLRLVNSHLVKPIKVQEEKTPDGRVKVHFIVEEFPNNVEEVIYRNAHHLRQEELEGITSIKKGMPLNPALNQKACFDIQDHYKKLGRIFTSVKLEEGGKPGDKRVVFSITESRVVKVRNITYEGNGEFVTGNRLATQVDPGGAFPGHVGLRRHLQPGHARQRHAQAQGVLQQQRLPGCPGLARTIFQR